VVAIVSSKGTRSAATRNPEVAAAAIGLTVAAVVVAIPAARFHIISPAASPVLIAGCGAAAVYVAQLAARRFARGGTATDFAVAAGLGLVGLADLILVLYRGTLTADVSTAATLLPYHLVCAVLLAASVVLPVPVAVRRTAYLSIAAAIATLGLALLLLRNTGALGATDAPAAQGWRIATCAALALAAAALASSRAVRAEPLLRWAAVAMLSMAAVHAVRVAEPITRAGIVTWAHAFYAATMLALLAGGVAEARRARGEAAEHAAADERRRVARDIHDGPAQDMAFVASQSWHLARASGDERLREIALAAERALDDSRAVVDQLTKQRDESLEAELARLARACHDRWGLDVGVALESSAQIEPWQKQELVAIVREALSNAGRHADADHVEIRLGYRRGVLTLTVSDDGHGFDQEAVRRAGVGFGIRSISERAKAIGGDAEFESARGRGTRIQVPIP
jgi:signal transduction histidine kinase